MSEQRKILLKTFGCQMNRLDSELVLSRLLQDGYVPASGEDDADVILFNTCSVRLHAEDRVFSLVGELKSLKRKKPGVLIGVIGCMAANRHKDIRASFPFVGLTVGPGELHRLPELLECAVSGERVVAVEKSNQPLRRAGAWRESRFSASIAVMQGCDNFCSYCIVPYVRGREFSRPAGEIVEEAQRLLADGVVEITLLGQNISAYGANLSPRVDLADLFERLDGVAGLKRIHFITSHPATMTARIIDAMAACEKVCEYLHLPAQSGSDRILKSMKRGYDVARYREIVDQARRTVPGIEIASDFIVGFPGETEEDFEATMKLVEDAGFLNCFVFKYSPRPGTAAAKLADDVPLDEKKRRNNILLDAQDRISLRKRQALVGRTVEVLVEGPSKRDSRVAVGRTRNNYIVHFETERPLAGKIISVEVTGATSLTVTGRLVSKEKQ